MELANQLIHILQDAGTDVETPATQLLRIAPTPGPGVVTYQNVRPRTPLSDGALITNALSRRARPWRRATGGARHRRPGRSALRLREVVRAAGPRASCADSGARRPLRVITTTYIGATERRALDQLVREFGAEVQIQYDAQRTRLHAKAWLLRRNTGFDTAFVGSSNLSKSALLDGVEWNVRLSGSRPPS